MRIGLAIDASTDLPATVLAEHHIHVLPVRVFLGKKTEGTLTGVDPAAARAFYDTFLAERWLVARTEALTREEFHTAFVRDLVLVYDHVFLLTLIRGRSPIYKRAHDAAAGLDADYRSLRAAAGITAPFSLEVIDAKGIFTGPGVVAWDVARRRALGADPKQLRETINRRNTELETYVVSLDPTYARARAARRGDRSVGVAAALAARLTGVRTVVRVGRSVSKSVARGRSHQEAVGKLFAHATRQVRAGLSVPVVNVSFGGDPGRLAGFPQYAELRQAAQELGVTVLEGPMSIASGISMGAGAVTLAYATAQSLPWKP